MRKKLCLVLGAVAMLSATPMSAEPRGDEPVAVSRAIKQGIDFVYVDPKMSSVARRKQRPQNWLQRILNPNAARRTGAPNPMFAELSRGLQQYQATWGRLPQDKIPAGPTLKSGSTGKRVALLRTRLGLPPEGGYDEALAQAVSAYQTVHGLWPADGIAGRATIASLNRGATYYARRIAINMERAYRLPQGRAFDRYVVVDSGAAEVYLFDRDRRVDSMRVVVGTPKTKTPMMAVLMRDAKANPYWNVPPELVRSLTAKRINEQGISYLKDFHYEVLSDWGPDARVIDPKTVNWKGIASGKVKPTVRVRQLPGPWNSMRNMKFEMPNDYGIYLHDTPHPELFAEAERHLSNGCVRLEDYRRFASWVFGNVPQPTSQFEQVFPLPRPVPVYMTYLTVAASGNGVIFRPDPYGFDALAMPQMFGTASKTALAPEGTERS
ncbi:L,D-transpeptidase family protein [Sphingomonas sp. G124]|uniref:L,D-transpeptidase family protein n=1 Tax=Sphingomonas cremea TaxID=2904799 RepID=A0A9X1QPE7_9SPHN|nr:L,D-transpeptidase family protein [Sphingomonas cremea]MCF2515847.1 L,D-transpeptidase family protein [Sphingomonas cremea]